MATLSSSRTDATDGRLVLIVGRTATGKSTAGRYLQDRRGYVHLEASDAFNTLASTESTGPLERVAAADRWFQTHGYSSVARVLAERVARHPQRRVAVVGLRTPLELLVLASQARPVLVVHVVASPEVRALRYRDLLGRGAGELAERDVAEEKWGLLGFADELADVTITNEDAMSVFATALDQHIAHAGRAKPTTEAPERLKVLRALSSLGPGATTSVLAVETGIPLPRLRTVLATSRVLVSPTEQQDEGWTLTGPGFAYLEYASSRVILRA